MVAKVCSRSHGQPVAGARKAAMMAISLSMVRPGNCAAGDGTFGSSVMQVSGGAFTDQAADRQMESCAAGRGRLWWGDYTCDQEVRVEQPPPILAPSLPLYGEPISLDKAKAVMEAAEAEAAREGWPMVIAIVDSGGNLVMLHRMDQAQLGSIQVA